MNATSITDILRRAADEITLFDSTGIAIEDAAAALVAYARWHAGARDEPG